MPHRIIKPVLAVTCLAALTACAGTSYIFHKDDVTWESYRADRSNCFDQLRGDAPMDEKNRFIPKGYAGSSASVTYNANVATGFASGFASGWNRARMESQWADYCMIYKGYTAHQIERAEWQRISDMDDEARTEYLRALGPGAASVHGPDLSDEEPRRY